MVEKYFAQSRCVEIKRAVTFLKICVLCIQTRRSHRAQTCHVGTDRRGVDTFARRRRNPGIWRRVQRYRHAFSGVTHASRFAG